MSVIKIDFGTNHTYKMNLPIYTESIATKIVEAALKVHRNLGPGLLEIVYEACLEYELKKIGLDVQRQVYLPIFYDNMVFNEGLKLDLLVENLIIIELKAVEKVNPLWQAQIISHLKLLDKDLGFLINFNVPLMKQGIKRYRKFDKAIESEI